MPSFESLGLGFFCADLEHGKIQLKPDHTVSFFLIVNHINGREFIKDQSLELLMTNYISLHLYGNAKPLWKQVLDQTQALFHPNSVGTLPVTAVYDNLDDFVNEINLDIHVRSLIPHDTILLYDDTGICHDVLNRLGIPTEF